MSEKEQVDIESAPKKSGLTAIDGGLTQQQLLYMMRRTPRTSIYTRPAKGGGEWRYVTGAYVKKVLNFVFAWNWNFQIIDKGQEGDSIWVQGRLTVKDVNGNEIIKEQFGRADVKLKKDGKFLDYGNDLKAAATDSLKKCASELGIASDVYNANEYKEVRLVDIEPDKKETERKERLDDLDGKIDSLEN